MAMSFGGRFTKDSAIPPSNTGLSIYAQQRVNNTTSRAIARHSNALFVDGIYFNVWIKQLSGVPCTCCDTRPGSLLDTIPLNSPDVNANYRQNKQLPDPLNVPTSDNKFQAFQFTVNDQAAFLSTASQGTNSPAQTLDFTTPLDNPLDSLNRNLLLENLSQPVSDDDLARLVNASTGGTIYGGDKTACGICFSTGFVGGFQLVGGQRLILDASGTNLFTLNGGALIDTSCHPFKFQLNSMGSISWTVDLPAYALSWLNIAVNNNLRPAYNTLFQIFYNDTWQEITLGLLLALAGTNTTAMQLRVIADPAANVTPNDVIEFTHAEISYMNVPPMLGQAPQLPYALNYDQLEALINTNFELLASIPLLPRESILQDSRTNLLWRVTSVTPKITAANQLFSYDIDVRKIASSEAFYRLLLPLYLPTASNNQLPVDESMQVPIIPETTNVTFPQNGNILVSQQSTSFVLYQNVSGGQGVAVNVNGAYPASSDSLDDALQFVGVALQSGIAGSSINVAEYGVVSSTGWNWTVDQPIFLGLNGALTQVVPVSGVILTIGTVLSPQEIFIRPDTPILLQ